MRSDATLPFMVRRIAATSLWFFAAGWGFNLLSAMTGLSPGLSLGGAVVVATIMGMDPLHLFWPRSVRQQDQEAGRAGSSQTMRAPV